LRIKSIIDRFKSYSLPARRLAIKNCLVLSDTLRVRETANAKDPAQAVVLDVETGMCQLPISRELSASVNQELGLKEIWINGATGFNPYKLVEVRILPRNNTWYTRYDIFRNLKKSYRKRCCEGMLLAPVTTTA
jgi:putative transposase